MSRRYFLADPSLLYFSGHCFGYLNSMARVIRARGDEAVLLGNLKAAPALRDEHGVIPAFSYVCDHRELTWEDLEASWEKTRHVHEKDIRHVLRAVAKAHGITKDDVVFLNTLKHWPLRGIVDWLEELPAGRRPSIALVLHFTSYPEMNKAGRAAKYYREAFHRIVNSPVRDRIHLFADTEELIAEYHDFCPSLPVQLAPIPHVRRSSAPKGTNPARRWRIGYAGEARKNKGFNLIPYLAERLEREGFASKVELHVHTYCSDFRWAFYPRSVPRLNQEFVVAYPDEMDEEEYYRFIESIDLMLVPYHLENYHAQTSGIFSESMAYGQVIVAPRGTWMGRQLAQYGGGRTFVPDDALDLSEQVLQILRHREDYQAQAARRAETWLQFHNPERLLELVAPQVSAAA